MESEQSGAQSSFFIRCEDALFQPGDAKEWPACQISTISTSQTRYPSTPRHRNWVSGSITLAFRDLSMDEDSRQQFYSFPNEYSKLAARNLRTWILHISHLSEFVSRSQKSSIYLSFYPRELKTHIAVHVQVKWASFCLSFSSFHACALQSFVFLLSFTCQKYISCIWFS